MNNQSLTFESVVRLHMTATPERQKEGLRAWAAALEGNGIASEDEGRALNITEAAKRAGLSRPVLYAAAASGALRVFVPYDGARQRVTERELSRWMSRRK
jgi:hypothetical protein